MKLILFIILISAVLHSQSVYEPVNSDVYNYLENLSASGFITFDYEIKPLTRIEIAKKLLEVELVNNKLNDLQKKLLDFYLIDFEPEIRILKGNFDKKPVSEFFITKADRRLRFFEYAGKDFSFYADPILSGSVQSIAGERLLVRRNGLSLYGYTFNNWAYGLSFYDNEESGKNLDINKTLSPERGTSVTKIKKDAFEYDVVTASLGYQWSNGSISIGKDYFKIGSGKSGNIILSDKAPSFPFIRFDYKPVDWLRFFYFHGFLVSNVADSATFRYNRVPNRISLQDVPKFIAFHSISIYPSANSSFTLGESIIYSDYLQPIYFIPVMFFRVADHYLGRGNSSATGNAQMFADGSYSIPSIKIKFYGTLFIDELSLNSIFSGGNLSAIGYTVGLTVFNLLTDYSSLNIEYTRINPFVYMNSVDAQTFTNDSYLLGDWIGSNGDIVSVKYKQNILRSLEYSVNAWYFRKGKTELPIEQYTSPYPKFLYGAKRYEKGFDIRLKYRPCHPVNAEIYYRYQDIIDEEPGRTLLYKLQDNNYFGLIISYGF